MFRKIREAFRKFVDSASQLLYSKEKLIELTEELKIELVSNDVAFEVAEDLVGKLKAMIEEDKVRKREDLVEALRGILLGYFNEIGSVDIVELAKGDRPFKLLFFGINGVGKTTTIAKVAVHFRERGLKPLMVASDTFRAGAQEQLRIHSSRTGIPMFAGKYGADPASVAFDAIKFAANRGYDVLLIDTAGRMHVDVDLVNELKKVVRVVKPHFKVLVVDALTGNDAIEQAKFFHDAVGIDGVIVTKVDAYEEGGVPLSVSYFLRKPIIFVGVGQDYKDLKPFNPIDYVERILSDVDLG